MLRETLEGAELIRIASAYFETGGWQLLEMVLRGREIRLLPGRPQEGSNRIQTLLDEFMDSLACRLGRRRSASERGSHL